MPNSARVSPTPPAHVIGSSSPRPAEESLGAASTNPLNPALYLMVSSALRVANHQTPRGWWMVAVRRSLSCSAWVSNPVLVLFSLSLIAFLIDGDRQLSQYRPYGCGREKPVN
jgi:hypothetical protein